MELRHLRYFIAIGEEQHYGRAAGRLRVAQPALSRQIQDLEKELGFPLFDRLPRGVKLNSAGELFLKDARRILQEISEAALRAGRVARGHSGTLRVGFTENSCWRGAVPESLRRFRELQRDAELQLQRHADRFARAVGQGSERHVQGLRPRQRERIDGPLSRRDGSGKDLRDGRVTARSGRRCRGIVAAAGDQHQAGTEQRGTESHPFESYHAGF